MLLNWLRRWQKHQELTARGRAERRRRKRKPRRTLLALEPLENRVVLSSSIPLDASTWTPLGPAPVLSPDSVNFSASGRISAIAVAPNTPSTIYAGAASGGVWKSLDSGQTWTPLTDSQVTTNVGSIAIAPSNTQVIYVGTGESNFTGLDGDGILRSQDGGQTWKCSVETVYFLAARSIRL